MMLFKITLYPFQIRPFGNMRVINISLSYYQSSLSLGTPACFIHP